MRIKHLLMASRGRPMTSVLKCTWKRQKWSKAYHWHVARGRYESIDLYAQVYNVERIVMLEIHIFSFQEHFLAYLFRSTILFLYF